MCIHCSFVMKNMCVPTLVHMQSIDDSTSCEKSKELEDFVVANEIRDVSAPSNERERKLWPSNDNETFQSGDEANFATFSQIPSTGKINSINLDLKISTPFYY